MQTAAFVRAEGPLFRYGAVRAAAWFAANAQDLGSRAARLGGVALAAPFGLSDPTVALRLAWGALRGTSEDRLEILGEEYWATQLQGNLVRVGQDLVDRARADGHRVVLLSDHPDCVARHLAAAIRADDCICNHLELRAGRATGRIADPLASRFGGPALQAYATAHGLSLAGSLAYGTSGSDIALLAGVGRPCAVDPAADLRRAARDLDWPVVVS